MCLGQRWRSVQSDPGLHPVLTCAFFPGVDDTVSVLLQYPGGVHGSFTCSISSNLLNTAYVNGTKGMAQVRHRNWSAGDRAAASRGRALCSRQQRACLELQ